MPDSNALVLKRTRETKAAPFVAWLSYVDLANCAGKASWGVTELSSGSEAALENNFEGMTRISDDLLMLVTDKTLKDGEPTWFVLSLKSASQ